MPFGVEVYSATNDTEYPNYTNLYNYQSFSVLRNLWNCLGKLCPLALAILYPVFHIHTSTVFVSLVVDAASFLDSIDAAESEGASAEWAAMCVVAARGIQRWASDGWGGGETIRPAGEGRRPMLGSTVI